MSEELQTTEKAQTMTYRKSLQVNHFDFLATVSGLLIEEHPLTPDVVKYGYHQEYLNALTLALLTQTKLLPFLEDINGSGVEICDEDDAFAHIRRSMRYDACYLNRSINNVNALLAVVGAFDIKIPYDVALLVAATQVAHRNQNAETQNGNVKGYVYLLRSPSGYWKIGRTVNPADRLRTFSVKLPFEVNYEHLIPCRLMTHIKAEKEIHGMFAQKRTKGEWFDLSEEDVASIKSIEAM